MRRRIDDRVRGELIDDALCFGLVLRRVLRRPPIAEIALRVELASLIVEAVAHLVADDGTDASVVHSVVRIGVEERRLENAGGKLDLIQGCAVRGIHRRRHHAPLRPIDGFAEPGPAALPIPFVRGSDVLIISARFDEQGRVITPRVRIGDLAKECIQLRGCLLLGRGAHPIEPGDPLAEGAHEIVDHLRRASAGLGREIPLHVLPADGPA